MLHNLCPATLPPPWGPRNSTSDHDDHDDDVDDPDDHDDDDVDDPGEDQNHFRRELLPQTLG